MNKHQQLDRKVLTLAELCDYLRIHKTTAYRLVKRGKIPAFRIGSYGGSTSKQSTNGGAFLMSSSPRRDRCRLRGTAETIYAGVP